jgi:hypothetical protein
MTMIADPTTETFMIGDDGELLGSAWFIDDRDQQRTHIGYIARISDEGEATIKLTEAGTKIMTPATLARYRRGWHVGVTLPPKQQHWKGQLIAINMEPADTPPRATRERPGA